MRIRFLIIISSLLILAGCGAAKDSQQKRNLMMPSKSDLPRNDKYSGPKKKKTYKTKKKKKKKKAYTYHAPTELSAYTITV